MVRQLATTALLLVHFSDSPRFGGCGCGGVECFVPFGVLEAELASDGQDGCRTCAYGVCGLREGGCVGRSPRLLALRRG